MLWIILMHCSITFGYFVLSPIFPKHFDVIDQIAIGIPVGATILSYFFWLIRYISEVNQTSIVVVICLSYSFCILMSVFSVQDIKIRKFSIYLIIILLSLALLFIYLYYHSILYDGIYSRGQVFSDLPFHMSIINSFAFGMNKNSNKLSTFFYAGEDLIYPFIPDFWSSIFVTAGASQRISIAMPSVFTLLSLLIALHRIGKNFSKKKFVSELTLIFFFFVGGTGWKWMFNPACHNYEHFSANHYLCRTIKVFWLNPLMQFLLPQRSSHFSQSLDIYIIEMVYLFADGFFTDIKLLITAGFIMGLLPLISAHSYIAVGLYAIIICIISFPWKRIDLYFEIIKKWAVFGSVSLTLSIPQILHLARGTKRQLMSFNPVWNESEPKSYKTPWHTAWYSMSTFAVISLFLIWPTMNTKQKMKYFPSLLIFLICSVIRFQPTAMDNTKIIFPAWLPYACAAVANYIITMTEISFKKKHYVFLFALVVVSMCFLFSSFYHIYKFMKFKFPVFNIESREVGFWVAEHTHPLSTFMMCPWMSNPISSISGRGLMLGYLGWVWTHGLDPMERIKLQQRLTLDQYNYTAFKEHGINYVLASRADEKRLFDWKEPDINSNWMLVLETGTIYIYRLIDT